MKLNLIVFLVSCFFIIACDMGITLPPSEEWDWSPGEEVMVTLNFKGIVTAAENDSPIQGAEVRLNSWLSPDPVNTVVTDIEGRYSMHYSGVINNSGVQIVAVKPGYVVGRYVVEKLTPETQVFNFRLNKIE